jgi:hypothetical protein
MSMEIEDPPWLFDTWYSSSANPRFLDLVQEYEYWHSLVETLPSLQVEVEDGHFVYDPAHREVLLNLIDDSGGPLDCDSIMLYMS